LKGFECFESVKQPYTRKTRESYLSSSHAFGLTVQYLAENLIPKRRPLLQEVINTDIVPYKVLLHHLHMELPYLFRYLQRNRSRYRLRVCLVFAKNTRQMGGNYILVDEHGKGRYLILDEGQEEKIIPAEFVRAKYSQAKCYFSIYEGVKNKLYSSKPGVEQQKIQELQSEIDSPDQYLHCLNKSKDK
jgi:hypothetical protein